jgi:hypothetical protein
MLGGYLPDVLCCHCWVLPASLLLVFPDCLLSAPWSLASLLHVLLIPVFTEPVPKLLNPLREVQRRFLR